MSFKSTIIIGAMSLVLVAGAFAQIPAITPTVDGTVDAGYGTAVAVQTVQTSFGDHPGGQLSGGGGELDALYLANDGNDLYVMASGNQEMNWNGMIVFIDNVANVTGDSATLENVSGGDGYFEDTGNGIGGMVLPDGFNADLIVVYKAGNDPVDFRIQAADYVSDTVVFDVTPDHNTGVAQTASSFSASVVNSLAGSETIQYAVDNSNGAGVDGGSPGNAVPAASAEAVTTGLETAIPLALIPGSPSGGDAINVLVAYCSGDGNFFSNQILPNAAAPIAHYATDPDLSSAGAGITAAAVTLGTPVLPFSDDFNTDTSANYTILVEDAFNGSGSEDYVATFAFDYSTYTAADGDSTTIPVAPNTGDSSQIGLKLEVNQVDDSAVSSETVGLNVLPTAVDLPAGTDWRLTVDMFIAFTGDGTAGGGTGSTEFALFPFNNQGTQATWKFATSSVSGEAAFGVTGDGGDGQDYAAYLGNPAGTPGSNDGSLDPALMGFVGGGQDNHFDTFYQGLFPDPTPLVSPRQGAAGKQWVEVEILYVNDIVSWSLNGSRILTHDVAAFSGGVTPGGMLGVGMQDTFSSVADPTADAFALFDNLVIEEVIQTSVGGYELYR